MNSNLQETTPLPNLSFGPARLKDAIKLSVVLKTVYIQAYAVEGVTDEFANFITERFSTRSIQTLISKYPDQFLVAYYNGNPVGVSELLFTSACPIRQKRVPELSKLYVLERFYGQGIGYGLLKEVEKVVVKKGYTELNLEVYCHNQRAIAFYERQAYKSIGTVDFVMEANTYKNFVMNKELV